MKTLKHLLRKIFIYGGLLAVLGGGGWWGYRAYKNTSLVEGEIEKVTVTKGDIAVKFQDIGDVRPRDVIEVYSRVGGRVTAVLAREGDTVKKGDKLAVVQPGQTDSDKYVPVDVAAPISGTVLTCSGNSGSGGIVKIDQRISGLADGSPACLMQVGDFTSLVVGLNVSEMEVMKLRAGLPVKVTIDALPALPLSGRITLISPQAESSRGSTKSFKVEIGIDQKNLARVKSGMTSRIEAVMDSRRGTLVMPVSGLFEEKGRQFAYLYVPGGKSRKADIKTGLRNETEVEVLSGLKEGDTVYADKPLNIEADDAPKPAGSAAGGASGSPASPPAGK
ncbi:MAG TPA: HlyD family efflux transporter periplasmic adaptor subunit [Elusimicrobiales bacterium]|nr:HlyD family efflux transporter periplasmic adaptor subunit [Elusimicrobiales bacterium]